MRAFTDDEERLDTKLHHVVQLIAFIADVLVVGERDPAPLTDISQPLPVRDIIRRKVLVISLDL
jgi:hypothetical protein